MVFNEVEWTYEFVKPRIFGIDRLLAKIVPLLSHSVALKIPPSQWYVLLNLQGNNS